MPYYLKYFCLLRFCFLSLIFTSIIIHFSIKVTKADGYEESDTSSQTINVEEQTSEERKPNKIQVGVIHRNFPEVSPSKLDQLVCYMSTGRGIILDLTEICVQKKEKQ